LGYQPDEDKAQYCERIFSDPALNQLLKIEVTNDHSITQTANHRTDTRMAAGDYHESSIHYHRTLPSNTT
jgi:hypothetical protein